MGIPYSIDSQLLMNVVNQSNSLETLPPWYALPEQLRVLLPEPRVNQGQVTIAWGNYRIASVFQPIVSFSHNAIVGHEALMRPSDLLGQAIPPPVVLDMALQDESIVNLDRSCRLMHLLNARQRCGWIFLNVHPRLFDVDPRIGNRGWIKLVNEHLQVPPGSCILEVTEESIKDLSRFEEILAGLREEHIGLAIDDFGAGHSNFDRVWRIKPDIVKLDRSFAARCTSDLHVRRMLPRLVDLLHETGAMVLLEGIETLDQALIAMDADIDFGQGWLFARPAPLPHRDPLVVGPLMTDIWTNYESRTSSRDERQKASIAPHLSSLHRCALRFAGGTPLEASAREFLALPGALGVYLLDRTGQQIGATVGSDSARPARTTLNTVDIGSARWSRRQYFRRAIAHFGEPQVTRPYVTMDSGKVCVTVSIGIERDNQIVIVCADVDWETLEVPL